MTENEISRLDATRDFIRKHYAGPTSIGIVLGSGIGNLAKEIEIDYRVAYNQIPDFPVSTVKGHSGELIFGRLAGKRVVAMAGRFHYYEGYRVDQVVFPVRLMKWLGVQTLLLSNAAGGMNPGFRVGDLMLITDHISLFTVNPLIGPNNEQFGPRFPDMSEPYKRTLIEKAKTVAVRQGIEIRMGVYAGVTGPAFETRAEYKLLHLAGADAVGMSTVQEAIAAVHLGMEVLAMSIITDMGIREEENVITHEEVLEAARQAEPRLTAIFKGVIEAI
ncbi:MAG TPA: purine-nucleoside phosphorylase [Puia sp.]|nr:purine-nucleoside phosphorylase [Puia sp.]